MKKLLLFFFLILFSVTIFINLGRFVDVTQKPVNADIIVSLGGGLGDLRQKKTLNLYKDGFSKSGKIIYTGGIKKYYRIWGVYLENNGILKQDIIHIDKSIAYNTMEEIFFIKQYMLKHHMKSVIFVSHPQHSRRITILANSVAGYKEAGIDLVVVSAEPRGWNREEYYKSRTSIRSTMREIVKLFYNLIKYNTPLIRYTQYSKKTQNGEWETALEQLDEQTYIE